MRDPTLARLSTSTDSARSMAVAALSFLAADHERLERFLSVTGLGPHNLRGAAADPGFYGSVLDYFLADEPLLLAFAAEARLKPEEIARARQTLSGPRAPDGS
jgi:Protein of unknown function (DUF3572)